MIKLRAGVVPLEIELEMVLSSRARESLLLNALVLLIGLACLIQPLSQSPTYHEFADQRAWGPLHYAMDVLSNLPFALWGAWGVFVVGRSSGLTPAQKQLCLLFFFGLVVTAACSAWYHLAPTDARLAVDRQGMTLAFAGLMGLCIATRVSERAGVASALLSLILGSLSIWLWLRSGNLLPWVTYQLGGMGLMLGLLLLPRLPTGLPVAWLAVLGAYGLAKALEWGDHAVFESTGWVSGHSLKHVVASLAAWPVIDAIRKGGAQHR